MVSLSHVCTYMQDALLRAMQLCVFKFSEWQDKMEDGGEGEGDVETPEVMESAKDTLTSVVDRMGQSELDEFELDRSSDFSVGSSVGQRNRVSAELLMRIYEVCTCVCVHNYVLHVHTHVRVHMRVYFLFLIPDVNGVYFYCWGVQVCTWYYMYMKHACDVHVHVHVTCMYIAWQVPSRPSKCSSATREYLTFSKRRVWLKGVGLVGRKWEWLWEPSLI